MLKIGLTGGIGCGKSTVSSLFQQFNVPVIDADVISHHIVKPGQKGLALVVSLFGENILLGNGELNRTALRDCVFFDLEAKKKLEDALHPMIFEEIRFQLNLIHDEPYCIVSIPLLFETQSQRLVDRVLVVDCDKKTQYERVQKRDNLTISCIDNIISTQVSAEFRRNNANDILDNSKDSSLLAQQVKKLHNFYISLSLSQDTALS
ncbi:MAG: dephospho-CoA kinase [Methylococcaceae bacterium]